LNISKSRLQNYQPENSASQYQLPKSHFLNQVERESLFLTHDPISSSFLSKPGHNCPNKAHRQKISIKKIKILLNHKINVFFIIGIIIGKNV